MTQSTLTWSATTIATATLTPLREKSVMTATQVPLTIIVTRASTRGATARTRRMRQSAMSSVGGPFTTSQSPIVPCGAIEERAGRSTPPNWMSGISAIDAAHSHNGRNATR